MRKTYSDSTPQCCITPFLICNLVHVFRAFLQFSASFISLLFVPVKRIILEKEQEEEQEGEVTCDDVEVVMQRLGMVGMGKKRSEYGILMEGACELLEEKTASLEELKEAFYVFDRDEDGFISPAELWSVMRRLGLQLEKDMRLEDCERMINAYDEDGDGKISFSEFKNLLENAI
ncbi:putative calcium-binding protein CML45 [Canna indica]|uniref:Calcium-binding protein CML45 n=1 Tax=Canna indica TaxID=4628 RepID=A0AAQ3KAY5_9LILI|nr:putative calcium-binding protein CML45 [Canna indica]